MDIHQLNQILQPLLEKEEKLSKSFDLTGNNMFYIKISNFLEVILGTAVVKKIIPRWYDSRVSYANSVSEQEI